LQVLEDQMQEIREALGAAEAPAEPEDGAPPDSAP